MKPTKTKTTIAAIAAVFCSLAVLAADYTWDKTVTDGYFNDPLSWGAATAPGTENTTLMQNLNEADYTVRFPNGYEPCIKEFTCLFGSSGTRSISFLGSLTMPSTNTWKYGGIPFSLRTVTSGGMVYGFEDYSYKAGIWFTNLNLCVSRDNGGNIKVEHKAGRMDAMTNGTAGANIKLSMGVPTANSYEYLYTGGTFNYGGSVALSLSGKTTNLFEVSNCATVTLAGVAYPGGYIGASQTNNFIRVTGADSRLQIGTLNLGSTSFPDTHMLQVEATDHATLDMGIMQHNYKGKAVFHVKDGATFNFNNGYDKNSSFANVPDASTVFRASDAFLNFNSWFLLGKKAGGPVDFRAERTAITSGSGEYYSGGAYVFDHCTYTNKNNAIYLSANATAANNGKVQMAFVDSDLWFGGSYEEGTSANNGVIVGNYHGDGELVLTNSTARFNYFTIGDYYGTGVVMAVDSDIDMAGKLFIGNVDSGIGALTLVDTDFYCPSTVFIGQKNSSEGTLTMTGGTFTAGSVLMSYLSATCRSAIKLTKGAKLVSDSRTFGMGVRGRTDVTVEDGARLEHSHDVADQLAFGMYAGSVGTLTVDNATVYQKTSGSSSAVIGSAGTGTLTMRNGAVFDAQTLNVGRDAGGSGTLDLTDCRVRAMVVGGSGTSALTANGVTNEATKAGATLSGLTTATIGAKGLWLDTAGYDVTVNSAFSGAGTLTKTGAGTLTVQTNATHAMTVVEQGTLAFSGVSSYSPAVKMADGTALTIDMGKSIALSALSLTNRAQIVFTGATGTDGTYSVLTVSGSVDAATKAAWSRAVTTAGVTAGKGYLFTSETAGGTTTFRIQVAAKTDPGAAVAWQGPGDDWADGANWDGGAKPGSQATASFAGAEPKTVTLSGIEVVGALAFGADGYTLNGGMLQLNPLVNAAIGVTAGSQTIQSDVVVPADTAVSAAKNTSLTVEGKALDGGLVKTGDGALTLAGDNELLLGASAQGGLLAIENPAAFGGSEVTLKSGTLALGKDGADPVAFDGTLKLDTAYATNVVGIRADSDVSMAAPTVNKGIIVKTGRGRLAFTADKNVTIAKDNGAFPGSTHPTAAVTRGTNADSADNGYAPEEGKFGGFDIAEGEVKLSAASRSVTYTVQPPILLGVNTPAGEACAANPALTLADCSVTSFVSGNNHMMMGAAIAPEAAMTGATLSLTNTYLTISSLYMGQNTTKDNLDLLVAATNSTIDYIWGLWYAGTQTKVKGTRCRFLFKDSSMLSGDGGFNNDQAGIGTVFFDFDNSVVANRSGTGPLKVWRDTGGCFPIDAVFRNGSVLRCNAFYLTRDFYESDHYTFRFDGGYWEQSQTADAKLIVSHPQCTVFRAEGAGLKFAPVSGITWTLHQPITGTGAIVKEGAGTLAVGAASKANYNTSSWVVNSITALAEPEVLKNDGGLELNAGTVAFLAGSVAPAGLKVKVTGDATLKDAALDGAFLTVDPTGGATLTLDGCTFSGRTTVDGDGATVTVGADYDLFAYAGTAPDVSKWRATNLIGDAGQEVRGTFTAADGKVTMTVVNKRGLCVIFR